MKPFNFEQAQAGKKIVTRNGDEAEFLTYTSKAGRYYQVIARVGDIINTYSVDGVWGNAGDDIRDLFMAPEEITSWLNCYSDGSVSGYPTKQAADICAVRCRVGEAKPFTYTLD